MMTKGELIKALDGVPDDAQLFPVSEVYDPDDDATWDAYTQTQIKDVRRDGNDVYLVLSCGYFDD